ncbi:MAG: rhombosortase [Pseudomonadota bacterium]
MIDSVGTRRLRIWLLPTVISLVSLVFALGETEWRELLRYDRDQLAEHQVWRWLSAHLVHLSWSHLWLNLAGLWVVWWLFSERFSIAVGMWIVVCSIVVMDLGFWFRDTQLGWYVGLSGVLHGLFAAGALDEFWRGVRGGVWLLLGITTKLAYEQAFGALPMTAETSGGPVWVNSHLYGAIGGLLAAIAWNRRQPFTPAAGLRIFSRS